MERRDFLQYTGLAAGALVLPVRGRPLADLNGALTPIPTADKKALADAALGAARSGGATYADVRIGRYLNQSLFSRDGKIQGVSNSESYGAGIRVIANGTWGFAATNDVSTDGLAAAARQAVAIARAMHFDSDLIILDEPTNNLGVAETKGVLNFVREARDSIDRLVRAVRGETDIPQTTVRIQSVFPENIPSEI